MENKIRINIDIILFIIFLMLKLDGIINWQWIWIFSPFWITWIAQGSIILCATIVNLFDFDNNAGKYARPHVPLIWDPKAKEMYGPFSREENVYE